MEKLKEIVKKIFSDSECPDCGFFFACDKCSERFDAIDEELKKELKENR